MKTGYAVGDVMTRKPVMVSGNSSLRECAKTMEEYDVSTLLIGSGNKVDGIVTEEDMVRKVLATERSCMDTKIKDIMETNLITITPDKDIFEALMKMRENDIRHLPVMHGEEIIGLVTMKDILKVEPALFDVLLEKIHLREEENKPIADIFKEGELKP